jgi:thymidylate kinase
MGQTSGTTTRYINPYTGKVVSDRYFRQKTAYRKFAKELNIEWQKDWSHATGMNWD